MEASELKGWQRYFLRLRHYLAELVLIVIGILIAFSINAWWTTSQQRDEELRSISALQQQFNNYRTLLVLIIEDYKQVQEMQDTLLGVFLSGIPLSTVNGMSIDSVLGVILIPGTTDFGAGELESLMSSGRVDLISDQLVREQLISWQAVYDELFDDEVIIRTLITDKIYPHMADMGLPLAGVTEALRGTLLEDRLSEENSAIPVQRTLQGDPDMLQNLLRDRTLFSYFEQLAAYRQHALGEKELTLAYIDELLTMLANYQQR